MEEKKLTLEETIDLLTKDLSARQPYGVTGVALFEVSDGFYDYDGYERFVNTEIEVELASISKYGDIRVKTLDDNDNLDEGDFVEEYQDALNFSVDYFKPYLRPMSTMTPEEEEEYNFICHMNGYDMSTTDALRLVRWLLEHKFDINGLIPLGLAKEMKKEDY